MKKLILFSALLVASLLSCFAGGPGLEIREALVHELRETQHGYALVVSGVARIGELNGIKAEKAVVTQAFGHPAYHVEDKAAYQKRLTSLIGTTIHLQVWGDIVTLTGGRITAIHGGVVRPLHPHKEEQAKES